MYSLAITIIIEPAEPYDYESLFEMVQNILSTVGKLKDDELHFADGGIMKVLISAWALFDEIFYSEIIEEKER